MQKNILVTGGAGYIGSHTSKSLAAGGYVPVVLDNLTQGQERAVKWGSLIEGDVGNQRLLRRIFDEYKIQAVIHFAGSAYIAESMQNPRKYFDNNVAKCLSLLNAIIDSGVRKVVFSSTCATYGIPERIPIEENHPQSPTNPYGETKVFIEKALHSYRYAYGLRFVALRYFNAAGADPEGEIGENHVPETHLIPLAIRAAMGSRPNVTIFGTDFPTHDGTAIRDYVHVTDLANAHTHALRFLDEGGESTAFNLGVGSGYSVREVIRCVEHVVGRSVKVTEAGRRSGDPAVLVARAEKAQRLLGWKPAFQSLRDIVETAYNWEQSQHESLADPDPNQPTVLSKPFCSQPRDRPRLKKAATP